MATLNGPGDAITTKLFCLATILTSISISSFYSTSHERSLPLHQRHWRKTKRIAKALFAPEILVFQSFIKFLEAYENVKAAREISGENWTYNLSSIAISGNIYLQDETGRFATLEQPVRLLARPQRHLWKQVLVNVQRSITPSDIKARSVSKAFQNIICEVQKIWFTIWSFMLVMGRSFSLVSSPWAALRTSDYISEFQSSNYTPAGVSPLELYTLTVCICSLAAQLFSQETTPDISHPFSVHIESLPADSREEHIAERNLWMAKRSKASVQGRFFSVFEDVGHLIFHLVKIYFLKREYSVDRVSTLVDLSGYIGILLLSVLVNLAISPNGPFLRAFSLDFPTDPKLDTMERFYSLGHWKILVEQNVAEPTISDGIKIFLQSSTTKPIIWWPLTDPVLPLSPGQVRISWLSESLEDFSIDVLKEIAGRFEKRLQGIQDNQSGDRMHQRVLSNNDSAGQPSNVPGAIEVVSQAEPDKSKHKFRKSQIPQRQYPLDPSLDIELRARNLSGPNTEKLVHWCIGTATAHVHNICVEAAEGAKTGSTFISELLTSYRKFRGLRWWFSLTDLAQVKFIKFIRIIDGETPVRCRRNPVTVSDIRSHGEYEIETSSLLGDEAHIDWAEAALKLHLQDGCDRHEEINELIAGLPRRKINIDRNLAQSIGYGIIAEQGWALWKFLIMMAVSTISGLVIFVWWLCEHPGDLQNASVPFFMILAIVGTFVAVPDIFF